MRTPRTFRTFVPALVSLLLAPAAWAGTVKGVVHLPDTVRSGRLSQGYWRLENGSVPVRAAGPKAGAVVLVDGISGQHPPPPKTVTVEIAGLDAQPRMVVIGPGSVVEFKNMGKVTHELSTPATPEVMPIERLVPSNFRRQRFAAPGAYVVRCSEYPNLMVSVLVVESPFFAVTDDKGGFNIPSVPDGKATLKVWAGGRWVHEQSIDTSSKQDLSIQVAAKAAKDAVKEPEPEPDSEGKESAE